MTLLFYIYGCWFRLPWNISRNPSKKYMYQRLTWVHALSKDETNYTWLDSHMFLKHLLEETDPKERSEQGASMMVIKVKDSRENVKKNRKKILMTKIKMKAIR